MAPKTDRVKVSKYFQGLTVETNNFAFEVKVILGLKTTFLVCRVAGSFGNITNSVGAWGELGNTIDVEHTQVEE